MSVHKSPSILILKDLEIHAEPKFAVGDLVSIDVNSPYLHHGLGKNDDIDEPTGFIWHHIDGGTFAGVTGTIVDIRKNLPEYELNGSTNHPVVIKVMLHDPLCVRWYLPSQVTKILA